MEYACLYACVNMVCMFVYIHVNGVWMFVCMCEWGVCFYVYVNAGVCLSVCANGV